MIKFFSQIKLNESLRSYIYINIFIAILLVVGVAVASEDNAIQENGRVKGAYEANQQIHPENSNFLPIAEDRKESDKVQWPAFPQKIGNDNQPELTCNSSYVVEKETMYPFVDIDSGKSFPIASITKLMTTLVFIENNPGWETIYEMKEDDRVLGGRVYLYKGDKLRIRDLFYTSLVASANTATNALVNSTGISTEEFVNLMNKKAIELGMENSHFVEPTGLHAGNTASAKDLVLLVDSALDKKDIAEALNLENYSFYTLQGKLKTVHTTDKLMKEYPKGGVQFVGGKTGYTEYANYCFVSKFINKNGKEIYSVVLGEQTDYNRFNKTDEIITWINNNFIW